jgi:hypothetical protein
MGVTLRGENIGIEPFHVSPGRISPTGTQVCPMQ